MEKGLIRCVRPLALSKRILVGDHDGFVLRRKSVEQLCAVFFLVEFPNGHFWGRLLTTRSSRGIDRLEGGFSPGATVPSEVREKDGADPPPGCRWHRQPFRPQPYSARQRQLSVHESGVRRGFKIQKIFSAPESYPL